MVCTTYPRDPSTTVGAECYFPRRLERLEVLIWLEECLDRQGVDDPERQESTEDKQPLRGAAVFCGVSCRLGFLGRSHDLIKTLLYF